MAFEYPEQIASASTKRKWDGSIFAWQVREQEETVISNPRPSRTSDFRKVNCFYKMLPAKRGEFDHDTKGSDSINGLSLVGADLSC